MFLVLFGPPAGGGLTFFFGGGARAVAEGRGAAALALDDELAVVIDEKGFGGVAFAAGADGDQWPGTKHQARYSSNSRRRGRGPEAPARWHRPARCG